MKSAKEIEKESREIFLEKYRGNNSLKLSCFHTFLCPVALAEAMVKEHIVEDFDALELLVLRLYDVGFRSTKDIASLSGMNIAMVERALKNEITVYHHIDDNGDITEMGRKTLEENEKGSVVNHMLYDTPRRMQIEAVTGTVIPAYLEEKVEYMKTILEEKADGIVPRESVKYDEELRKEINDRLLEYKNMGILNEGDTIISVTSLRSTLMYYRWSYLVMFEGMQYPMIVMRGRKSINNVNAKAKMKGDYGKVVVTPLAISCTDAEILRDNGFELDDVIIREDSAFEYLREKAKVFKFESINDDISMDMQEMIYEDEKIDEAEENEEERMDNFLLIEMQEESKE